MLNIILFISYLAFFCFLLGRIKFLKPKGLSSSIILSLFLIQIVTGVLLGYLTNYYRPGGTDYWGLHQAGILENELLRNDPREFFAEFFRIKYDTGPGGLFDSTGSYWNDLRNNIIAKTLGVLNFISNSNYYVNSLFFNFLGFFGHVALFRMFSRIYPGRHWTNVILSFLIPSTLFFSAGIHKDLFAFVLLCFFCYFRSDSGQPKFSIRFKLLFGLTLIGLFIIRNYTAIALMPAALAYALHKRLAIRKFLAFGAIYAICMLAVAGWQYFEPGNGPLDVICKKQEAFVQLGKANTQLPAIELQPTIGSFLQKLPQAIDHGFLRPYPWETINPMHSLGAIELFLSFFIVLTGLFGMRKQPITAFELFMICFGITGLLLIGYVVPNYGSILRYRSLYLPFLLAPFLQRAVAMLQNILRK